MFKFTFESNFKDAKELREEIVDLLWKIDNVWPTQFAKPNIDWIKEKTDRSLLKIEGGYLKTSCILEKAKSLKEYIRESEKGTK
jgi:hypothetical protein